MNGLLAALLLFFGCSAHAAEDFPAEPQFILPVRESDVVFRSKGIWPFGARGGEHPDGHPGIDFDVVDGSPVLAAADGSVGFVGESGHHDYMSISIGHGPREIIFDSFYTGPLKGIQVQKGDQVKAGQTIALCTVSKEAGKGEDFATLHFGLAKTGGKDVCPAHHLAPTALKELEALFAKAKYERQKEFPLLCNPCPPSGCR